MSELPSRSAINDPFASIREIRGYGSPLTGRWRLLTGRLTGRAPPKSFMDKHPYGLTGKNPWKGVQARARPISRPPAAKIEDIQTYSRLFNPTQVIRRNQMPWVLGFANPASVS
jgi:hypothetical protein